MKEEEEIMPYGKMTQKELEKILSDLNKNLPKKREFKLITYCSNEQYQELRTGADAFDRAVMNEWGATDIQLLKRDIREFLSRNRIHGNSNMAEEYKRCKLGFGDMTGQEYFFYNYCYSNGRLPIYRKQDHDTFQMYYERYKKETQRIRDYKVKVPKHLKPISPEECFRAKNVKRNVEKKEM